MKSVVFLVALLSSVVAIAEVKIGTVDVQRAVASIEKSKRFRDEMNSEMKRMKGILEEEESGIVRAQEKYEAQRLVLNKEDQKAKELEFRKQIIALKKKSQKFQKELQARGMRFEQETAREIFKLAAAISEESGMDATFDANGGLLYARDATDLTGKVIEAYNKANP